MPFIDEAKISVKAGDGGKGCRSFYRDKYGRYPKPDGADGGKGADIIFQADPNVQTLLDFQFRQHFKGDKGAHGGSNNKKGKDAQNLVIKVPVGTIIKDLDTNFIIRDLNKPFEQVIVAKGGIGGRGNAHNKELTTPQQGEARHLLLELKLIADCGIIGFPNAGKSTLICALSSAKSKIASYPFTTKEPVLGVVENSHCHFVVADLPGLIEGANQGKGLGIKFLKHCQRSKILIHLLDMAGEAGRNPVEDFEKLNQELKFFSRDLSQKPQIIVANKMDLPQAEVNLKEFKAKIKKTIIPISAKERQGLNILISCLRKKLCTKDSTEKSNA